MNNSETSAVTHTHFPEDASEGVITTISLTGRGTSLTTDSGEDFTFARLASHPLFRATVWLYKVTLVVIFCGGTFGNTMILILQRRIQSGGGGGGGGRNSGVSVFVSSLAVSDSAMLFVFGITIYLYSYHIEIADFHDVFCKTIYWLIYALGLTSSWILVAMTMQRAASILWPHRVNRDWTARKARTVVLVIVVSSMALNSHILYGLRLQPVPRGPRLCLFVSEEYREFFDGVWPSVDTALSSFVPFVLIIASNVVLVRAVWRSTREARRTLAAGSVDQLKARQHQASGMTLTLVCVSLAFLLLTSPLCVFGVVHGTGGHAAIDDPDDAADNFFAEAVGSVLWLANNAINFYIYALTGSRYRAAMASVCGCHVPKSVTGVTRLTAVTRHA